MLGLENKIEKAKMGGLTDDVRYSIKTKSFNKIEPKISREIKNIPGQEKIEEKIYDITKVKIKDPINLKSEHLFDVLFRTDNLDQNLTTPTSPPAQ